jgi:uncharacterized membrane protein required for colicin V production
MDVVDIALIAFVALMGLINLIAGFHKFALSNVFTIAKIVLIVFLSTPVVGYIKQTGLLAGVVGGLETSLSGLSESLVSFLGDTALKIPSIVVNIIYYAIAVVALFMVISIVFALLKLLAKKISRAGSAMKVIDRILGLIYGVAFSAVIALVVLAVLNSLAPEIVAKSLLNGINPLNSLLASVL